MDRECDHCRACDISGTCHTCGCGNLGITEASLLDLDEILSGELAQPLGLHPVLGVVQLTQLGQEPGVDVGQLEQLFVGVAVSHRLHHHACLRVLRREVCG